MARNRITTEANKGLEMLRHASTQLAAKAAAGTSLGVIGPFAIDVDVVSVTVTPADAVATHSSNTVDVFNGTVAANKPIVTQILDANLTGSVQVPFAGVIVPGVNTRVPAGTPITVRLVTGAGNTLLTPVSVYVSYDIPFTDPTAKVTSFGTYDGSL